MNSKYTKKIVLFADILGFKQEINASVGQDNTENKEQTNKIANIYKILDKFRSNTKFESKGKKVNIFSDSIVVSFPYNVQDELFNTLNHIQMLCVELLEIGILLRGGISIGMFHHNKGILFGPALILAHELESKKAVYPRIILPLDLIKETINNHNNESTGSFWEHYQSIVSKDTDGYYYIDYFPGKVDSNLGEYKSPIYKIKIMEFINKGLQSEDPSIRQKYQWMNEKIIDVSYDE
jgi:hypothetical protein